MIPIKRVAKVLGCALVMGFGAELYAGLWENLPNRPSWMRLPSRAGMPTREYFRDRFDDFRNWFDDNVHMPKDKVRAEASFDRRELKLRNKLGGLESSASYVASAESLRKKAVKLSNDANNFYDSLMMVRVGITAPDSSDVVDKMVNYKDICDVSGNAIKDICDVSGNAISEDAIGDMFTRGECYFKLVDAAAGKEETISCKAIGETAGDIVRVQRHMSRLRSLNHLADHAFLTYRKANMEWNDGKITRFLPATYEQRYGALSGTLATAMLMRWISTREHPGQQVKKLAKVPGWLLSRARGMITRNPSE